MTNDKQKDRLVELLKEVYPKTRYIPMEECREKIADAILADGWMRPPCKVGDKVYIVSPYYAGDWEIYKCKVDSITVYEKNTFISYVANDVRFGKINFGLHISEIGKTVFLTKEEAEEALGGVQG